MLKWRWLGGTIILLVVLATMCGCKSGSSNGPQQMTESDLLRQGQTLLECVTTNLLMPSSEARKCLNSAATAFITVLSQDATNTQAKMGLATTDTLLGYYDLMDVSPDAVSTYTQNLIAGTGMRHRALAPMTSSLTSIVRGGRMTRNSGIQSTQMRIATTTLPALKMALPMFEDVEHAAQSGTKIQMKMYQGGQIRTVTLGVADIQLLDSLGNLIAAFLNLSITYDLDMPNGVPVVPLPVDQNGNGMFDPEEYLISSPFLTPLYSAGMANSLKYLGVAASKAELGAGLTGHASGPDALLDVTNQQTQNTLNAIEQYATLLSTAWSGPVTTTMLFGDGIQRTINLPRLVSITSLRSYLPSFQASDLTAPGVWPDPTFHGAITPGVPQGYFPIYYSSVVNAYQ